MSTPIRQAALYGVTALSLFGHLPLDTRAVRDLLWRLASGAILALLSAVLLCAGAALAFQSPRLAARIAFVAAGVGLVYFAFMLCSFLAWLQGLVIAAVVAAPGPPFSLVIPAGLLAVTAIQAHHVIRNRTVR
jgi:hypothetical protein